MPFDKPNRSRSPGRTPAVENFTEFGEALFRLGMTQKDFAAKAGVSHSAVNRWCGGSAPVPQWATWLVALLMDNRKVC